MKIQRSSYELKLNGNSLEILGPLEFDETWPTTPFLYLLTRKNKFPVNMGQNLNSFWKWNFGLIS
jgi:hypothetical protein